MPADRPEPCPAYTRIQSFDAATTRGLREHNIVCDKTDGHDGLHGAVMPDGTYKYFQDEGQRRP